MHFYLELRRLTIGQFAQITDVSLDYSLAKIKSLQYLCINFKAFDWHNISMDCLTQLQNKLGLYHDINASGSKLETFDYYIKNPNDHYLYEYFIFSRMFE